MGQKNGFFMLSFIVYLGLYICLSGIIFSFCSLYFQWVHSIRNQIKSLYAYHSAQKKFANDSFECVDIKVTPTKIVFLKHASNATWTIKNNCLIRKESLPGGVIYLCTTVEAFQPFLCECLHDCFLAGFKVKFFRCPFTISTLGQRRK